MKTKDKKTKDFDTVKTFRDIKVKIANEIQEMNFDQLKVYLAKTKLKS
jgi:hypothetical protein